MASSINHKKKSAAGGKRPNAGRPKKEPTELMVLRVPAKLKQYVKAKYGRKLHSMAKDWLASL